MITKHGRHLSIIIAFAMLFTGAYIMMGQDANAASKPKAPKSIKASYTSTTATIKWSKVKKNVKGYAIYRNNKLIKTVGPKVRKFKDSKLKPRTKYSYKVRAFNKVKKKRIYGSYSAVIKIKTLKAPKSSHLTITDGGYTVSASQVKAAGGTIKRNVLSTQCANCKVYGKTVTFTYDGKTLKSKISGSRDYSKECHHCDSVDLAASCGQRLFTEEGEINKTNRQIDPDHKYTEHYEKDDNGNIVYEEKDGDQIPVKCKGVGGLSYKTYKNIVYCFACDSTVAKPSDLPAGWPNHNHN